MKSLLGVFAVLTSLHGVFAVGPSDIRTDNITSGPPLEIVHYYTGQWPTGIAVSSKGRKFANFPAGLDFANTYNGTKATYQVAELTSEASETAYPNATYNQSPGGAINRKVNPPVTKGDSYHLLGVQSVIVDSIDTLWILDTGRVQDPSDPLHTLLNATIGGPKLVNVDLNTNQIVRTFILTPDLVKPDSYLNDVRIDRNPKLSGTTGKGAAYITDSSLTGDNALVFIDLGSGKGIRLPLPQTHPVYGAVPFVYGEPMYEISNASTAVHPTFLTFGSDGIAVSADFKTLYFGVVGARYLYSVPTAALRDNSTGHEARAAAAVINLGEKGESDGFETDSNGIIYGGSAEQYGIFQYNPKTAYATILTRDPRINWVDTLSVATDGYLYFNVNQLNFLYTIYSGSGPTSVDRRQRPFVLFRVKLPNGGTKVTQNHPATY